MKKLIFITALCALMLTACGDVKDDSDNSAKSGTSESSQAAAVDSADETAANGESSAEGSGDTNQNGEELSLDFETASKKALEFFSYLKGGNSDLAQKIYLGDVSKVTIPQGEVYVDEENSATGENDSVVIVCTDGYTVYSLSLEIKNGEIVITEISEKSKSDNGVSQDTDVYVDNARKLVKSWCELMSNAEYSKAAELMTEELCEEGSMSEMVDGENPDKAECEFDPDFSVNEQDGKVIVKLGATLIPEEYPDQAVTTVFEVTYEDGKYLISKFDADPSENNTDNLSLKTNAKTFFTACATVACDWEVNGNNVKDDIYYSNDKSEFMAAVNELLSDFDFDFGTATGVVEMSGNVPVGVAIVGENGTAVYPEESDIISKIIE